MSTCFWSSDCLGCLCNLPHTLEEHTQEVELADYERQILHEDVKRTLADLELDEVGDETAEASNHGRKD